MGSDWDADGSACPRADGFRGRFASLPHTVSKMASGKSFSPAREAGHREVAPSHRHHLVARGYLRLFAKGEQLLLIDL